MSNWFLLSCGCFVLQSLNITGEEEVVLVVQSDHTTRLGVITSCLGQPRDDSLDLSRRFGNFSVEIVSI